MKKTFFLFVLMLCVSTLNVFSQLEDDGYTSDIHEKFVSKTVFSKSEVLYQEEDEGSFVNEFSYGDPIYGRMYWYPGINNIYDKNGWSNEFGYFYFKEILVNGKTVFAYYDETENCGRTTLPICLNPISDDNYHWNDRNFISNATEFMTAGTNEIEVILYPYDIEKKQKGDKISSGKFQFNITAEQIKAASNYEFSGFKTRWSSGDEIWNKWEVYVAGGEGGIETTWKNESDRWEFSVGSHSGEIKTVFSGDYSRFELSSDEAEVTMKRTFSNDWTRWEISDGTTKLELKTSWSSGDDIWKEWDLTGNGKMNIKTSWSSGDDIWKEWAISDNLVASPELKMAAIFLVIFNASVPE